MSERILQDNDALLQNSSVNRIAESGYESVGPNSRSESQENSGRLKQYLAAFTATLSALAAGTALAWTSPILNVLELGHYRGIKLDDNELGWIGSFITLGGMIMCFPTGFICDVIGRKTTLLLLIIPFTIGWLLILLAKNVLMLYFGRLITGMAAGACCVAAPLYTSEIAHKTLRGTLGTYFQLMVTVGIFLAYLFGKYLTPINFTIWCMCIPFVFVILFAFQPETPHYLFKKGKPEEAKLSLARLRGMSPEVLSELLEIEGYVKENSQVTVSIITTLKKKSVIKACIISFSIMFFQQMSGINAIILYTSDIFKASGVSLDPQTASIIVGAVQVIATFISSIAIDRLGRKVLLFISALVIAISTLFLAAYFTLKYRANVSDDILSHLSFLPVCSLCLFIIGYSLGLGPVPWLISSEIFPNAIKSSMTSAAGTFSWFLAFLLTKFYLQITHIVGQDATFYTFSIISLIGTVFIFFIFPETKGKTLNEIQKELER